MASKKIRNFLIPLLSRREQVYFGPCFQSRVIFFLDRKYSMIEWRRRFELESYFVFLLFENNMGEMKRFWFLLDVSLRELIFFLSNFMDL